MQAAALLRYACSVTHGYFPGVVRRQSALSRLRPALGIGPQPHNSAPPFQLKFYDVKVDEKLRDKDFRSCQPSGPTTRGF